MAMSQPDLVVGACCGGAESVVISPGPAAEEHGHVDNASNASQDLPQVQGRWWENEEADAEMIKK
jgi:hypothetical protein